jgi:hypothetical protein
MSKERVMVEKNVGEMFPPPPPSTPRIAPWDAVQELCNRLDRLLAILEGWTPGGTPGVPGIEAEIKTIWEAGPTQELLTPTAIRTIGTTDTEMVDFTKGKRLLVKVSSSLNQNITVQPVGHIKKTMVGAANIGLAPIPCPAGATISIGFAWGDWHPYIGITLNHAIAPASGTVGVKAVVQE